jgi:hypothetical protein
MRNNITLFTIVKMAVLGLMISLIAVGALEAATLDINTYKDKLRGGWVGQMAGVMWGWPTEFFYQGTMMPESRIPTWNPESINGAYDQDDLYVEIPFMDAMKNYGTNCSWEIFGEYHKNTRFPLWHANAMARSNLRNMGIKVPWSGHYSNQPHADDIGWQIESDFIGMICPGQNNNAIELAWRACHVIIYGDGAMGGIFISAMYTAAFFANSVQEIIDAGLAALPDGCEYKKVQQDIIAWHARYPDDWTRTWQELQNKWTHNDRCPEGRDKPFNIDAKINGAYVLMGLLYGNGDLENTMLIAMRGGQDSDCNPSSAGGILGCFMGYNAIPDKWKSELSTTMKFSYTDYTLQDCLDLSTDLAREVLERTGGTISGSGSSEIWTIPDQGPIMPPILEQWPRSSNTAPLMSASIVNQSGNAVEFTVTAGDPDGIADYQWFFGDHTYSNGQIITHYFPDRENEETYEVICYVTDGIGNTSWDKLSVTIPPGPHNQPPGVSIADEAVLHSSLTVSPNPFNNGLDIILQGQNADFRTKTIEVGIYDINGRLLDALVSTHRSSLTGKYRWDASGHAAGLYLVKIKDGSRELTKRVTLIK